MAGIQVGTNTGVHATGFSTSRFNLGCSATNAVHVRGRTAKVADHAGKAWHLVADVFNFTQDGAFASALDDATFVLGDRAKRTTAKTTTHDVDAETNHLPRRNFRLAIMTAFGICIDRMRAAGIGQVKHVVHLGGGERYGRRVDPNVSSGPPLAMRLHQCSGVAGVGFQVQHTIGVGVKHGVALDLLVTG